MGSILVWLSDLLHRLQIQDQTMKKPPKKVVSNIWLLDLGSNQGPTD